MDEIPLVARIVSVADVYDALTSDRVYKEAITHEKALSIVTEGSGTQFDPMVVRALIACEQEFRAVRGDRGEAEPQRMPERELACYPA